MLKHLFIKDFAIINQLDLDFSPGMTVLTGETGAGKSMVVGALNLVLGGRAQVDVIRFGCESAEVAATFVLREGSTRDRVVESLREQDIPLEDDALLVRRVVSMSGRSKAFANGVPITVAVLSNIARGLVDITGQHEHVWLMRPDTQLELLDAFASLMPLRADVRASYRDARALENELKALEQKEQKSLAQEDFLRFQIQELRDLNAVPGEETRLLVDRKRLANVEKLRAAVAMGEEALYGGEQAVVEVLSRVGHGLRAAQDADQALAEMLPQVEEAQTLVEEVSRRMARFLARLEADPARLAELDERLEKLRRACRKHACPADGLTGKLAELEAELSAMSKHQERLSEVIAMADRAKQELGRLSEGLSVKRRAAAARLAGVTLAGLAPLGLAGAQLAVAVEPWTSPDDEDALTFETAAGPRRITARGMDRVEFRFSANHGEAVRPLSKVASGGELSRLLLALKRALAAKDPVPVYVFDEVDVGMGGAVAEAVGGQIRAVSGHCQALCITHLPQIAAQADHHWIVEKGIEAGRTVSRLRNLGSAERVEELARMLGGKTISDATRRHARDMLRGARSAA
jgi:DNA repair protein RecN (Recombination protein N)